MTSVGARPPAFVRGGTRDPSKPVHLVLKKDLSRTLRAGHPWLFADAFESVPANAPAGSLALVKDKAGNILSKGFVDATSSLAYRSLALQKERLDDALLGMRLERAVQLRLRLFPDPTVTNGFRLFNGEGDGLPGLTCDVYDQVAVMKLDGSGPAGFYNEQVVADWLMERFSGRLATVWLKYKSGSTEKGRLLAGKAPVAGKPLVFVENGAKFQVDVVVGQKTGFFLDQRDNRARIGRLSAPDPTSPAAPGPRVLNVFGYNGGFSIYAGRAGASHVTTIDIAPAAIEAATANWALNRLPAQQHDARAVDAFEFLKQAGKAQQQWDVVIVDPPSFAPNKQAVETALTSYENVFSLAAQVTGPNGILALASCSSHVTAAAFNDVCLAALNRARRRGYVLCVAGQPEDHPSPAAADELRYLKFNVYQLEG